MASFFTDAVMAVARHKVTARAVRLLFIRYLEDIKPAASAKLRTAIGKCV